MPESPRPLPLVPLPAKLRRPVAADPDAMRALRELALPAPPPPAVARGKARTAALLTTVRKLRRPTSRDLQRRRRWEARQVTIATRLGAIRGEHPRRTPEQVLADVVRLARRRPADPMRFGAAALVVRPAKGRTAASLLGNGPAAHALVAAGVTVRPLRNGTGRVTGHVVRLPVRARDLGQEIENVAWAVRRLTGADVVPDRHELVLFRDGVIAVDAPAQTDWHLRMIKADRAHALPPGSPAGKALGKGAVIAHPDCGWARHPQYFKDRIDVARSLNTATGQTGGTAALHPTRITLGSLSPTLTHGTATGCLIVGGDGTGSVNTGLSKDERVIKDPKPMTTTGKIVGIAPLATVVPIKFLPDDLLELNEDGLVGSGVIRLGDGDFVEAIQYAVSIGADVMSLSVGGMVSAVVEAAMATAIRDSDLIVVAAAGQTYVGNPLSHVDTNDTVIEPARFRDVIAAAGCSTNGERWAESLRGPNVDITAPCDAVWVADFDPNRSDRDGKALPVLVPASGTSFAAAIVAGAAAVWVAHWGGRAELKKSYPDKPLAWVFREMLQRSAARIPGQPWDEVRFGPGILNIERLLGTPLPPQDEIPEPPATVINVLERTDIGLRLASELLNAIPGFQQAAATAIVLAWALAATVDEIAEQLVLGYAALEEAAGELAIEIGKAVAATETLLRETAAAAEEMAEEAADTAEDVVDAVVKGVEDLVEAGGEALDDFLTWP